MARPRKPRNQGSKRSADERRVQRAQALPTAISYPPELPVAQRRDEIAEAIRDHQVVIVAGETGSGKTTQLPKICLELGRGVDGMIGHTQPRRLAARTVADRIASELGVELGGAVGYAVRFTDQVGDATLVKLMTDGILLAELQHDRLLSAYDTIIVDEAHERSLNIDFILGYLAQLLPKRPDLKVIVTSATIATERFAEHFGGAPIVEVTGRTYPVEMRYRPLEPVDGDHERRDRPERRDQITAITDAVRELHREGPGDVLVFLSGEREIRDTAEALDGLGWADTEVVPLYARLSMAEQHKVFAPHRGRRIVLATNVAETSLTVPGIRYVVDPGTARISRYSSRLKVQRLPIEAVSQASANQRAGRCGRVADGICIRLYAEDDFEARPEYTDPEILRTNLASVILQMTNIGLGDMAAFPFLDPPDNRAITDGIRLLDELGALEPRPADEPQRLTPVGRRLARLPVDPRFGAMVLEAGDNGCLREVLIIAAGLSIQDPRERPTEQAAAADQSHARFADPTSDFLAYVNLWDHVRRQQRQLSSSQFRRLCRREYLNFLRIREWQDVHAQLRRVAGDLGLSQNPPTEPADADLVHRSLLAGLLSHIGQRNRETREYLGARNAHFAIFPGSSLAKKPPDWVMAAELVETSRLWARTAARIQPDWVEALAGHLVKRNHSEPHWSAKRGAAMVYERVTLYGLPIVTERLVGYADVDREHARELFIRHGLVEGDWRTGHAFIAQNQALLTELEELEHRFRRRDLVVDADTLEELYDERLPPNVASGRSFDAWWKKVRHDHPDLLTFTADDLLHDAADELDDDDFPAAWLQGDLSFGLSYAFEPGTTDDGVAVHIPVGLLNQVQPLGFDWQVPGLRTELVDALIRTLPKPLRRGLVPVPETVREFLGRVEPGREPLLVALERELSRLGDERIRRRDFAVDRLPPHLRLIFLVVDADENVLGQSEDLDALKASLVGAVRGAISEAAAGIERAGLTEWDFGDIPTSVTYEHGGLTVKGFPALVDEATSVAVRVLEASDDQYASTWAGTRRLLRLTIPLSRKSALLQLTNDARLSLSRGPYPSLADLYDDCVMSALDDLIDSAGGPVWTAADFDALRTKVKPDLMALVVDTVTDVAGVLDAAREVERRIESMSAPAQARTVADVSAQRDGLLYDGFVSGVGRRRLPDVQRYLQAVVVRLDKQPDAPARDRAHMETVLGLLARYDRLLDALGPSGAAEPDVVDIAWMIEELRVSLFAQALGTSHPVSASRITKAIDALTP